MPKADEMVAAWRVVRSLVAAKGLPTCQVTVNGVGYTVGALPSVPSAHPYHDPAVAGVGTY